MMSTLILAGGSALALLAAAPVMAQTDEATLAQAGTDGSVDVTQTGGQGKSTVAQAAIPTQPGSPSGVNTMFHRSCRTTHRAFCMTANITQSGERILSKISPRGTGHIAYVTQTSLDNVSFVNQSGHENSAEKNPVGPLMAWP